MGSNSFAKRMEMRRGCSSVVTKTEESQPSKSKGPGRGTSEELSKKAQHACSVFITICKQRPRRRNLDMDSRSMRSDLRAKEKGMLGLKS